MNTVPLLRIDERSARRLKLGYPWVFRSEVLNMKEVASLAAGQVIDIVREKGDFVARGFFNPKTQLVARVLTHNQATAVDGAFVLSLVKRALVFRDALYSDPFYRLIHAESDGMPGLIVDRYGDVLVCQVNTAGMEVLWPEIAEALQTLLKPSAIVLKNDTPAREMEGLALGVTVLGASLPEGGMLPIQENGTAFWVDVQEGQKTGWFFDQRDNRRWIAGLAKGRTLIDVFCHTGGFGVTAGKAGAKSVTFVDSSAPALEMVRKNAELNHIQGKCEVIEGKAFDVLEKLASGGKVFDVVSVDPPAFIKSRKDMASGLKGYQKLAKLAAPLAAKGGMLFFASCSHHASVEELAGVVSEGLARSGRPFQLVKTSGAAPDHPVHPFLPETSYLKGFTCRFLD